MKNYNGGYQIIDLEDNDLTSASFSVDGIYEKIEGNYRKPILLTGITINSVEYPATYVMAKVSGSNYVINVYDYTLTIADTDTVTASVGTTLNVLMENIIDANGNKRFIEGEGTLEDVSGVTITYNKWTLSGSHLMIVLCGDIDDATVLTGETLATYEFDDYINDKIVAVAGTRVLLQTVSLVDSSLASQSLAFAIDKISTGVKLYTGGITLTADRSFRVQFDLVIDTE